MSEFNKEKTYWAGKGRHEIPLKRLINLIDEKLVYIKDALHPTKVWQQCQAHQQTKKITT